MSSTVNGYYLVDSTVSETVTMDNNVYVEWFSGIHIYTYNCSNYREIKNLKTLRLVI